MSLVLDSTVSSADLASEILVQFARGAGYSEEQQEEISLAVRECAANAVVHGNCCDLHKKVLVTAAMKGVKLVISIQDEGAGFDTKRVPDPLRPENVFSEHGRGLFLMKSLMDDVKTRRLATRGMKITMTKYHSEVTFKEEAKMALTVTSRTLSGVTVLDLNGRLILGEETANLRDNLKSLVSTGQKKILLNMEGVSYIDSSGLGALVGGYTSVAAMQGQLKLMKLSKKAKDLLQITKLLTVFEVFDDEEAAIKSYK